MDQHDNGTLMSILAAIGGIIMSVLAAVGIVVRLLVTGRGSIMNDVEMKIENQTLREELARTKDIQTIKDEIISEIKKTNGGG